MKAEDRVPITLRCFRCLAEREILIPRERGVAAGKYLWECFACQEKRYGVLGSGCKRDPGVDRARPGGHGEPENGQEEG